MVFVVGYPKSGTTWASKIVADYLQLPFPKHALLPMAFPCLIHGHELLSPKFPRAAYSMRDGRDVMVSYYFHKSKRIPEGDWPAVPPRHRRWFPDLDNKHNIQRNLPAFIEAHAKLSKDPMDHWGRHIETYFERRTERTGLLRFEDLLADGPGTLTRAVEAMTGKRADPERIRWSIEKFSFERQARRKRGQEQRGTFLRKGQAGDWKNHFTKEAAEVFDHHFGEALVLAGYEKDRSWVSRWTGPVTNTESAPEGVAVRNAQGNGEGGSDRASA